MNEVSTLIAACERAWLQVQTEHSDVPNCIVIVGSGGRRSASLYGHFSPARWTLDDNELPEVLIVAEQLKRSAHDIFTTLLHEAVHGIANVRAIKDVSGRRHNKRFAQLCLEVGLIPPETCDRSIGWSAATLNEFAAEHYETAINGIDEALVLCRKLSLQDQLTKPNTTHKLECDCGRNIRVSDKQFNEGAIICALCQTNFEDQDD